MDADSKLQGLFLGPCEIVEVVRPNRYRISAPDGIIELHAEDIKSYYRPPGKQGVPFHFYCPPAAVPDRDTYTVEKILDHRFDKKAGRWQWRCRWKDYGPEFDT